MSRFALFTPDAPVRRSLVQLLQGPWPVVFALLLLVHSCWDSPLMLLGAEPPATNAGSEPARDGSVDFHRDVQPIFARSCIKCHGGVKQAAGLSFIDFSTVVAPGGYVIEPGDVDGSLLWDRLTAKDPTERMPPPDEGGHPLSEEELNHIRRWIEQGARFDRHWSRMPLVAPPAPTLPEELAEWVRDPLDAFVADALRARGQKPNRPAPPHQWLRRVTFDLIGLPPTVEESEAFLTRLAQAADAKQREAVYRDEVDRLLASKYFGERWAAMWLDLARYADSKGFEKDPHRDAWPYRDWLISAFNRDMPYDEFTIRQLAGDLLPSPSYDCLLATAFHRHTQTNTEGGTDDEEFRIAAVIDRVNTTWTVWQATTFGCVQCHNHPYEPLENEEFYQCLAIFNNTEDCDLDDEFPTIPYLDDRAEQARFLQARRRLEQLQEHRDARYRKVLETCQWHPLAIEQVESTSGQLAAVGNEVRVTGGTVAVGTTYTLIARVPTATALRLDILPVADDPAKWPEQGSVLSRLELQVIDADGHHRPVTMAGVVPDHRAGPYPPEASLQGGAPGFGGYPKLFGPRWAVFVLDLPVELSPEERLRIVLRQDAAVTGGLSTHLRRFQLSTTNAPSLVEEMRSTTLQALENELQHVSRQLARFSGPRLPIMKERHALARRPTRMFVRGNWLDRDHEVSPGLPAIFARSDGTLPEVTNRLEFARWLVSADNPLAARVWVNRIWHELWGLGLVETLEDFGPSGTPPTHPQLLDHLAYSMQYELGWSLKRFLRKIVLSASYRQDSRTMADRYAADPHNRWLARGPRNRLSAEMVRDQALVASGMLNDRVGGASVMPPQPEGVWLQVYSSQKWETATGPDRFRRAIYTYWKRTSPYPEFLCFDAPPRDVCSPRRIVTNTPLQALVVWNSETYTELAHRLAARYAEPTNHRQLQEILTDMVLRITSRSPSKAELEALSELYQHLSAAQAEDGQAETEEQPTSQAEATDTERSHDLPFAGRLSPLAKVALTLLNTDWALTK
ncbi:MAG: cytochrome c [Pirellulaceae bacterium]|nr:MAG: cytochrome c [Pirellulaceae bacterium]